MTDDTSQMIQGCSLNGCSPQAYAVTKAAQIYLAKTLALVCAPKIRVNSVSPGMMLTVRLSYRLISLKSTDNIL